MTKWKYLGERKNIKGQWYYPDQIVETEYAPSKKDFVKVDDEGNTTEPQNTSDTEIELRTSYEALKMAELREIGNEYGAKDTSKKELIDEILEAKKQRGEL